MLVTQKGAAPTDSGRVRGGCMIQADRRHSMLLLPFLLAAVLTAAAPVCRAQAVTGAQVSGQVTDASGAGIPEAQGTMTQSETQFARTAKTDAQGSYTLPNLPVGPYILTVLASGFKRLERKDIIVQVGNNIQINTRLEIGAVSESVEVSAAASMVETKENAVAQVINQRQIVDLPMNGRQATQLILDRRGLGKRRGERGREHGGDQGERGRAGHQPTADRRSADERPAGDAAHPRSARSGKASR